MIVCLVQVSTDTVELLQAHTSFPYIPSLRVPAHGMEILRIVHSGKAAVLLQVNPQ